MNRLNTGASNVTPLFANIPPMKNPILIELLRYWERLRHGRIAPMRSEIDPREIENALEHAFILEPADLGEPRFRIAGLALCRLMGMEIKGMPAGAIVARDDRTNFVNLLEGLFKTPEIIELELVSDRKSNPAFSGNMLLLPLCDEKGDVSRILGCLVTSGVKSVPPNRLAIANRKSTRIVALAADRAKTPATGFAEQPDPFKAQAGDAGSKRPARPTAYLRLVTTTSETGN